MMRKLIKYLGQILMMKKIIIPMRKFLEEKIGSTGEESILNQFLVERNSIPTQVVEKNT